jgi:WD40 repeat protein
MIMAKLKGVAACLLVLALLAGGAGLLARQRDEAKPKEPPPDAPQVPGAAADRGEGTPGGPAKADRHGDPLPAGALARLGTVRFRHERWIEQVAVAPDGRAVAAVAGNGLVLWDAATGRPLRRWTFTVLVHCLAFAPDGRSVAVGGSDGLVRLLDPASGKELRRLAGHKPHHQSGFPGVSGVAFSADGKAIVTWGIDKTVRLWDAESGKELRRLGDGDWAVHGLSPDGKLLAVVREKSKKVLRLWDVATGKEVRRLAHEAEVRSVAFSPGGKALAVASGTEGHPAQVHVWGLAGGREIGPLPGQDDVFALAFSPDGKALASAGHVIRLWDLDSRKELHKTERLRSAVRRLAFSPDGKTLVCGMWEHRVRLWDVAAWRERVAADGPADSIRSLVHSPDGKLIASASGGTIWLWEAATGQFARKLEGHTWPWRVLALAFKADGKSLVSAGDDGTVRVWDLGTGKERWSGRFAKAGEVVALSPDGLTLAATFYRTNEVVLCPVAPGKELRALEVPDVKEWNWVEALCFSRDGRTLYAASTMHDSVLRWDVAGGKLLSGLGREPGQMNSAALAPDGRSLAVMTWAGRLHVWELATGQTRLQVNGLGYATSVAFSPDGRWLALADRGDETVERNGVAAWKVEGRGEVRLISTADGKVVRRFRGHSSGIGSLSFSPDGRTLASGGHDTAVVLWDVSGLGALAAKEAPVVKPEDLAAAWAGLRGEAAGAYRGMVKLMAAPDQAVRFLGERLEPVKAADPDRLAALLKRLDSDEFREREEATRELKKLGDAAESALRKALAGNPSAELRRGAEELLAGLDPARSPRRLREGRAVEVLEYVGTAEARRLLEALAKGAPEARLTREAKASLRRLDRRADRPR